MASKAIIREARPEEAGIIATLLLTMAAENWPMVKVNYAKTQASIKGFIENGYVVVAEVDNKIVGGIGTIMQTWWFSDDEFISDTFTFVHPDYRDPSTIHNLLENIKGYAKETGNLLFMGIRTLKDTERKNILFRRHLTPAGEIFFYDPEG